MRFRLVLGAAAWLAGCVFGCSEVRLQPVPTGEDAGTGGFGSDGGSSQGGSNDVPCGADWAIQFGFVDIFASQHTLVSATDCSIYVAGRFGETLTLGDTLLEGGTNSTNIFLIKLDPSGDLLWAKALGGDGFYGNPVLAATPAGDVVLSGTLSGPVDFGDGVIDTADRSPFLAAYDPEGQLQFARVFETNATSVEARSVTVGPSGDLWMAGGLWGSLSFGSSSLETPDGTGSGFLARFDANGELSWAKLLDTSYALPVVVDSQGQAIVGSPEWILKLDADGNTLWERPFIGDAGYVTDIALGASDSVILVGAFSGEVDLGFGPVGAGMQSGDAEGFLLALDASGQAEWAKTWVDAEVWQRLVGAAVRPDGNVVVFGQDRDFWHANFIEELSPNGEVEAHQTFAALCSAAPICDTIATGIRLDRDGNILLSAELEGILYVGDDVIDSGDGNQMVVAKLSRVTPDPE